MIDKGRKILMSDKTEIEDGEYTDKELRNKLKSEYDKLLIRHQQLLEMDRQLRMSLACRHPYSFTDLYLADSRNWK